jgi:hypothetical protein
VLNVWFERKAFVAISIAVALSLVVVDDAVSFESTSLGAVFQTSWQLLRKSCVDYAIVRV